VLKVTWKDGAVDQWHLENPGGRNVRLALDESGQAGLAIVSGNSRYWCDLFNPDSVDSLDRGKRSQSIYHPLCGGRLYLRNPAKGNRSALEAATDFLRDQVWGGEKVIILFHHLLGERYRESGQVSEGAARAAIPCEGPGPADVEPEYSTRRIAAPNLGIGLASADAQRTGLFAGAWYAVSGNPGVYVSLMQPGLVAQSILRSNRDRANELDIIERGALCYLVAFDLDRFEIGYALGTEHPEVDWSDRVPRDMRDTSMPGPDGFGSIAPLVSTGLIRPDYGRRTVATFTGGFKRTHGAFRYGDLALRNHGNHYGFIEQGTVFSTLQSGLATFYVLQNGTVDMNTWTDPQKALLPKILHARQNGVPLIETDPETDKALPGRLVNRWGPGNWSGSEDEKLRTIRGGVALQKAGTRRFLIYAVFSDATPSAMARVFQSYRCSYGMLLDMNALEHTYMALYRRQGQSLAVEHLIKGMSQLDKSSGDEVIPRFLGFPDNRDFFT
jgi:hypothetical protein